MKNFFQPRKTRNLRRCPSSALSRRRRSRSWRSERPAARNPRRGPQSRNQRRFSGRARGPPDRYRRRGTGKNRQRVRIAAFKGNEGQGRSFRSGRSRGTFAARKKQRGENCSKNQPKPHTDLLEEIYQREIEREQIDFEVDDVVIEFAVPVTVFVDAHDARTQAEKPDRCLKRK